MPAVSAISGPVSLVEVTGSGPLTISQSASPSKTVTAKKTGPTASVGMTFAPQKPGSATRAATARIWRSARIRSAPAQAIHVNSSATWTWIAQSIHAIKTSATSASVRIVFADMNDYHQSAKTLKSVSTLENANLISPVPVWSEFALRSHIGFGKTDLTLTAEPLRTALTR